jgi:TPR repeat protein
VKARFVSSLLAAAIIAAAGLSMGDRPVVAGDKLEVTEETIAQFQLLKSKADTGDRLAMRRVAALYYTGEGGTQDRLEAARWYKRAAGKGDAESMHQLATMYRYGNGLPVNYAEAARWETAAARRGHGPAQRTLGMIYLKGEDYKQATYWLRAAADQGDQESINQLILIYTTGYLYQSGFGGLNYEDGLRWMIRTAEKGNSNAQANLGLIYDKGKNDPVTAYMWYSIAAARGNWEARDRLQQVNARMTAPQIAQAQRLATSWWDRHIN